MTGNHFKPKGFTLIEVLLVFAIVSLLSSMILASTKGSKDKARTAKALEFSQTIYHRLGAEVVGIWNFEEGSGTTVNDASGFNNHGTLTGGAAFSPDTPYDAVGQGTGRYSISFDGVDDYVNCGNNASFNITSAITIEAWVKRPDYSLSGIARVIVRKTNAYVLYFSDASEGEPQGLQLYLWAVPNPRLGYSYTNFINNSWYHIIGTYNGSIVRLYVNGVNVASEAKTGSIAISANNVGIGGTSDTSMFFDGLIDDVRIYNQSLTSAQIQKHYAEGLENHQDLAQK